MASIRTLNNSAKRKGCAPNLNIGLSQPTIDPSQINPKRYIKLTEKTNFIKFLNKFLLNVKNPDKETATKKPSKYPMVGPVK